MIDNAKKKQFSQILKQIADSLDISETRYKEAEERYQAVGKWLGKYDSPLAILEPEIYPQGSFRLGTVVKPISEADEYDIDLVCELKASRTDVSQQQLKKMVGGRLNENGTYTRLLEEKNRCWRLNYAGEFHMDILPAIPDTKIGWNAIFVPDRALAQWKPSNPKGYAEWFKERMKTQYYTRKMQLAEEMRANIEDVPDYRVKTPLQRAIQILKRHRDIVFAEDPDDKPISIIITTLAAQAYDNEADLYEALVSIVKDMPGYIQTVDGVSWVPNPVNPMENFADKWHEKPQRELSFKKSSTLTQRDPFVLI